MDGIIRSLAGLRAAIAIGDETSIARHLDEAERLAAIVPEIAVRLEGGLVQQVSRANDAPFTLHVHDHDVEGTNGEVHEVVAPGGWTERAVVSTYVQTDDNLESSDEFWRSFRDPVVSHPTD